MAENTYFNSKLENEANYPGWMGILGMVWAVAGLVMIMVIPVYFYMMSAMPLSFFFSIMGVQKKRKYRKLAFAAIILSSVDLFLLILGIIVQLTMG